jgi:tRNA dimethylallyltransferase
MKTTHQKKSKILLILGTTASGKTSLGVKLAKKFSGEIISADSRQVYRGLDVGTGKDLVEYGTGKNRVPYHLIDVADPAEQYDLARYQEDARRAMADIIQRGKLPLIVGGSGLYLQAIVDNYQLVTTKPDLVRRAELSQLSIEELLRRITQLKPDFAAHLNNSDSHNQRRLVRYAEIIESGPARPAKLVDTPYDFLLLGLTWPDEILRSRIETRLRQRLEQEDLVREVENLNLQGLSWARLKSFGLEYKFISQYLLEEIDYETMFTKLSTAIYRFAKRQKTWFKRWEKQGQIIHWVQTEAGAAQLVADWLAK